MQLPEHWYRVSPTRYEYINKQHVAKWFTVDFMVVAELVDGQVVVTIESAMGGDWGGGAKLSHNIPVEIMRLLLSEA